MQRMCEELRAAGAEVSTSKGIGRDIFDPFEATGERHEPLFLASMLQMCLSSCMTLFLASIALASSIPFDICGGLLVAS